MDDLPKKLDNLKYELFLEETTIPMVTPLNRYLKRGEITPLQILFAPWTLISNCLNMGTRGLKEQIQKDYEAVLQFMNVSNSPLPFQTLNFGNLFSDANLILFLFIFCLPLVMFLFLLGCLFLGN